MSRWIFEIENNEETFLVNPIGVEGKLKWEREDDRLYDFKKSINDLQFIKEDYQKFLHYRNTDSCMEHTLRVFQMCGLVRMLRFESVFTSLSGSWDLDKCIVKFKLEEADKYFCTTRKRKYKFNPPNLFTWVR